MRRALLYAKNRHSTGYSRSLSWVDKVTIPTTEEQLLSKLLDFVKATPRIRHYSLRTETSDVHLIHGCVRFLGLR